MDSSLLEVWQTASGVPFLPAVTKGNQFVVGFALLLLGLSLTGAFALSEPCPPGRFVVTITDLFLRPDLCQRPGDWPPCIIGACVWLLACLSIVCSYAN